MTVADKNLDALPVVDVNTSDFNGTGGTGWDDESFDETDRGDDLTADTQTDENEKEPEPEQDPEVEQEPENTDADEGDTDADTDSDDESDDDADDEASSKPKKRAEKRVPYSRLQKAIQKRKELEAQLAAIKAQQDEEYVTPDVDVKFDVTIDDTKFKSMTNALLEGDSATAQQMFAEMLSTNVNAAAKAAAQAASRQAYDSARAEAENSFQMRQTLMEAQDAADIVKAEYEVFDDTSELFDKDIFEEAIQIRNGLMNAGYSVGEAITKAAEFTARNHGFEPKSASKPQAPKVKKPDVKAKMQQAAKNPPKVGGEPAATVDIDPLNMTMEEFENMDPKEIARLRGDYV